MPYSVLVTKLLIEHLPEAIEGQQFPNLHNKFPPIQSPRIKTQISFSMSFLSSYPFGRVILLNCFKGCR